MPNSQQSTVTENEVTCAGIVQSVKTVEQQQVQEVEQRKQFMSNSSSQPLSMGIIPTLTEDVKTAAARTSGVHAEKEHPHGYLVAAAAALDFVKDTREQAIRRDSASMNASPSSIDSTRKAAKPTHQQSQMNLSDRFLAAIPRSSVDYPVELASTDGAASFKVLASAASCEYEKKKDILGGDFSRGYSRKDKSLGLLCENFLVMYGTGIENEISLDDAAVRLGVERRRIYDIVNVLESVQVVVRKAKNRYTWHGLTRLPEALKLLKSSAPKRFLNYDGLKIYNDSSAGDGSEEETDDESGKKLIKKNNESTSRREKSLGLLSQKFVQLFLCSSGQKIVTLDDAAKILLGDCSDSGKLKTKVRRLYDIANILSSLNLIEKTHLEHYTRKPAFRWLCTEEKIKNSGAWLGKWLNASHIKNARSDYKPSVLYPDLNNLTPVPPKKRGTKVR